MICERCEAVRGGIEVRLWPEGKKWVCGKCYADMVFETSDQNVQWPVDRFCDDD